MADPPDERAFESETMGEDDLRLPVWFWPVIVFVVIVFAVGVVEKLA